MGLCPDRAATQSALMQAPQVDAKSTKVDGSCEYKGAELRRLSNCDVRGKTTCLVRSEKVIEFSFLFPSLLKWIVRFQPVRSTAGQWPSRPATGYLRPQFLLELNKRTKLAHWVSLAKRIAFSRMTTWTGALGETYPLRTSKMPQCNTRFV